MLRFILTISCILAVARCVGTETDNPVAPEGVDFIRSQEPYLRAADVPTDDQQLLQQGNLAFALDLYREIAAAAPADENIFISPFSISTLMAMTIAGARGNTETEIASALHFDLDPSALHPAMNRLTQKLVSIGDQADYRLEPLNSIWIQRDYEIQDGFLDVLSQHYDTGVYLADFARDPEATRGKINEWVSDKTEGYIEELFPNGSIDSLSRLALTNTVYFSALWRYPFDEETTRDGQFTLANGDQVTLPMMGREYWFPFAFTTDWRAVALPYEGTSVSMICVLPNEGEFDKFEAQLDTSQIEEIVKTIDWDEEGSGNLVYLTIPKFSFDSDVDLKEPLSSLGMADAFMDAADFSDINTDKLFIYHALQKTHIAIDEIGTVAVAAAGEVDVPAAIVPRISLARPFLFFIWDADTQTVLFVGRLVHPDGPVSKPTNIEPPISDAEAICGLLDKLIDFCGSDVREITEQQCIESLADDDSAIVEQCADCYRAVYDSCGGHPCSCDQAICVDECPNHPF